MHVTWDKSGEADVVTLDADRIKLRSTTSAAPGTPLSGKLAHGAEVRVKVHRCRREASHFFIEGRLVDAPRDVRAELAKLAGLASS
jgi:hypothetical protein